MYRNAFLYIDFVCYNFTNFILTIPWEHLYRHLEVYQIRSLPPFRSKILDKQIGLFSGKLGLVFVCYRCSAGHVVGCWGRSLPRTVSVCYSPVGPRMQSPLASGAKKSRGIPWIASRQIGTSDVNTGTPDACKISLGTPEHSRWRVWRWHLLRREEKLKNRRWKWLPPAFVLESIPAFPCPSGWSFQINTWISFT